MEFRILGPLEVLEDGRPLGSNQPDTARSLNNLAHALTDQGEFDTARSLHERAPEIREARLDP
jgi:Tetratricopeptide repeat